MIVKTHNFSDAHLARFRIEDGEARWLEDEPPHVRQSARIAAGEDYRTSTIEATA